MSDEIPMANPRTVSCPHCEKYVRVWFDKPAPGSVVNKVQATAHDFPTCDGYRKDDGDYSALPAVERAPETD